MAESNELQTDQNNSTTTQSPEATSLERDPKELFGSTPIARLFLTAALPGAVSMLVSSLYDVTDGILVGNFVGDTPFAAINLAMPFVIILFAFGDLIGAGSAVPISIALGENRDDDANNIFTCSCILNVISGGILGVILFALAPTIFALMGAKGELAECATGYLRVYALFAPLTTIGYAFDNYLRICGKIRWSFFTNIFMAVSGAVMEFILLAVFDYGVRAAALSYSLAMVFAALIASYPFSHDDLQLRYVTPHFNFAEIRNVFACGLSTFFDNVAGRITSIFLNGVLLALGGEEAVSIWGVAMFAEVIVSMLIYGTIDAMQPAVGYNWGARNFNRVKRLEYWCFGTGAVIGLTYVAVMFLCTDLVVHVFIPDANGEFLKEAVSAVRIISLSFVVRWFNFAAQQFLAAVGDAKGAAISALFSALVFPLPLVWILSSFGLTGIWLNNLINALITNVLNVGLLLRLRSRVREMRAEEQSAPSIENV